MDLLQPLVGCRLAFLGDSSMYPQKKRGFAPITAFGVKNNFKAFNFMKRRHIDDRAQSERVDAFKLAIAK